MHTGKHLVGISKIKPTLQQGLFSFDGIELDDHGFNVTTIKWVVNIFKLQHLMADHGATSHRHDPPKVSTAHPVSRYLTRIKTLMIQPEVVFMFNGLYMV